jgi:hypothetical protein
MILKLSINTQCFVILNVEQMLSRLFNSIRQVACCPYKFKTYQGPKQICSNVNSCSFHRDYLVSSFQPGENTECIENKIYKNHSLLQKDSHISKLIN